MENQVVLFKGVEPRRLHNVNSVLTDILEQKNLNPDNFAGNRVYTVVDVLASKGVNTCLDNVSLFLDDAYTPEY